MPYNDIIIIFSVRTDKTINGTYTNNEIYHHFCRAIAKTGIKKYFLPGLKTPRIVSPEIILLLMLLLLDCSCVLLMMVSY